MERLTFKAGGFNAFSSRCLCTYGGIQNDGSVTYIGGVADKLAEYEDLEEQGKLLKLPCAVGDTVYEIIKTRETISEFTVTGFLVSEYGIFVKWKLVKGTYRNLSGFNDDEIGKTVFLTIEEAEAALKE